MDKSKNNESTKECSYCKHILPVEAGFCPYCLKKFVVEEKISFEKITLVQKLVIKKDSCKKILENKKTKKVNK